MRPTTNPSTSKRNKRVQFADRVKIFEIEQIDHILTEEMSDENSTTNRDDYYIVHDEIEVAIPSASTPTNTSTMTYDIFSCSSSSNGCNNSNRNSHHVGPIRKPNKIPSMLFNSLQLPINSSSTSLPRRNYDRHQKKSDRSCRARSFNSSVAPLRPVRAASIDEIIGNALAIIEGTPAPLRADIDAQQEQKGNYIWNEYDFIVTEPKRWKVDCHSPPQIPRRKISTTSLEEELRRKKY